MIRSLERLVLCLFLCALICGPARGARGAAPTSPNNEPAAKAAAQQSEANAKAKRKAKKADQTAAPPAGLEPTCANVKYGPHERNVLDFWQAKSKKPTPLVVFIHGGGFVAGSKEKAYQTPNVIRRCLEAGVSFAAINYRYRSPTVPIQDVLRDSARAIQFMRSKAGPWNIDKARVASYGGSAGAGTSLWLAFHDDLADATSPDPVLRESSRLAVLGANACQCTYDLVRWKQVLGTGPADDRAGAPGAFYGLKEDEDLESPRAKQIRADVDMLGLLSKDDPPVYLYSSQPNTPPTERNHYVHHPKHAIAIKEKCDQLGIESVLLLQDTPLPAGKTREDVMLDFFFKHLGVAQAQPMSVQAQQMSIQAQQMSIQVSPREMTATPISPLLCSNFIEEGFGYQTEGMWSEMLFNRSFEKAVPLHDNTTYWYGLHEVPDGDWTKATWYHTGYEHNRWYACPGVDRPPRVANDETFFMEQADGRPVRIEPTAAATHGTQALKLTNAEQTAWGGVAQDGKFLRKGETYRFRGHLRRLSAAAAQAEVRFYATEQGKNDWTRPLARLPLGELAAEDRVYEADFNNSAYDGWACFSLWGSPGAEVALDAFSLLPQHTVKGWRPDVVAALRRVNPQLLRYPGGCFASFHDWRDAIGPWEQRKPEPSYFWGDWNYNDVGTKEFLELCQEVGAEPMLVVNLFHPAKRTSSQRGRPHGYDLPGIADPEAGIRAAADWVAYCNRPAGSHPMADRRAAHGHPAPFQVKYWEMDNEAYRWFSPEEYARTVVGYSRAMKAVDPSIKIGLTTYRVYGDKLPELLEIAGEHVDFFADRICEPANIARKIELLRQWNRTHRHQLVYADTEALQNRPGALDPYTASIYKQSKAGLKEAQRSWSYALCLGANLLAYHRCGGGALFMCFNNLANTMGQSCIETPKDRDTILTGPGYVFELMSRTEAAWPLILENYTAAQTDTVIVQAAWNKDRKKLVLHLLNRGPVEARICFDLSPLHRVFTQRTTRHLWAEDGMTAETVKSSGNVHRKDTVVREQIADQLQLPLPAFSLIEAALK